MKKILIIDDDPAMLAMVAAALRNSAYEVETCNSGQEGLSRAYEGLPDLILCDVRMPDIEGTTVLQALRVDPATADRQVVLMTGSDRSALPMREAMNLGADDFLVKPFRIEDLLRCVEVRLSRAELKAKVADRTYDDLRKALHSTLPHEFFTPLAGILGLAEMMRADYDSLSREEALGMLRDIERSGRRLHRTLSNYLRLLDLENSAAPPTSPPLPSDTVWNIVAAIGAAAADRRGRASDFFLEGSAFPIPTTAGILSTLVEELVDNACCYSRRGTPVKVALMATAHEVMIEVRDQGRGLTETQIKQIGIFQQFDRQLNEQQGLGLGLALVRKLIEEQGGALRIVSEPSHGSNITLVWPRPAAASTVSVNS